MRRMLLLCPLMLCLVGCVCCDSLPPGMTRATPKDASDVLQHAMRTEDWDLAYCTLSAETQAEVGPLSFSLVFPDEIEQVTGKRFVELIAEAEYLETLESDNSIVKTFYIFPDHDGIAQVEWTEREENWYAAFVEQLNRDPSHRSFWLNLPSRAGPISAEPPR